MKRVENILTIAAPTALVRARLVQLCEYQLHEDFLPVVEIFLDAAYSDVYYHHIPSDGDDYWQFAHVAR